MFHSFAVICYMFKLYCSVMFLQEIFCEHLTVFDDLELFISIDKHVSREHDVESSEPNVLTSVLLHGLLHVQYIHRRKGMVPTHTYTHV